VPPDVERLDLMDDETCKIWFGYNKDQFQDILQDFAPRCTRRLLAVFLYKIRTALLTETSALWWA